MSRFLTLEQKVECLRPEVGEPKDLLRTFLGIHDVSLEDALAKARQITEHVVNAVLAREGFKATDNLRDNLDTLGSKEEGPAKRRGGRPPLPPPVWVRRCSCSTGARSRPASKTLARRSCGRGSRPSPRSVFRPGWTCTRPGACT